MKGEKDQVDTEENGTLINELLSLYLLGSLSDTHAPLKSTYFLQIILTLISVQTYVLRAQ